MSLLFVLLRRAKGLENDMSCDCSTYAYHKAVDEAFRCRGEHSCYSGTDDMSKCTCLKEMLAALPGKCEVIDSVKAKKALECVEEIAEKWYSGYTGGFEHWLSVTLRKYGYEKKK